MFENDPEVISLGRMAIFFLPIKKLRQVCGEQTHESAIDKELIARYEGLSKITGHVEGCYRMKSEIVDDDHVRYEVSFLGKNKVIEFVEFLKEVCRRLGEESIYLTMGEKSYLVQPKERGES